MPLSFSAADDRLPRVRDRERADLGFARLADACERDDDATLADFAAEIEVDDDAQRLLAGIFATSPYLTGAIVRDPAQARTLLRDGPDTVCARAIDAVHDAAGSDGTDALMTALRRAKAHTALAIAVADIAGNWSLEEVTGRLSAFCDAALDAACAVLLRDAVARGALPPTSGAAPADGSGFVVLGLGKLGARELNYSSDIDLIVLYDGERGPDGGRDTLPGAYVQLTRKLVKVIEQRTADGYVFRTDLRLRPDPGATPVAMSMIAAETYYESIGQNWERAAMIKARPVAGDIAAGRAFLDHLRPFVWRRHLDFAAIDDIHSIKRQIHAHKGGSTVAIEGHDIKLGRGGIREIEFFAQTQQLIWGGRDASVRAAATVPAIEALVAADRIPAPVAQDMIAAYRYLRQLEHRLQMVDDQQTQRLPGDADGIARIAAFMGCDDADRFRGELLTHLRTVEHHYAGLFEEATPLGGERALVFTGADDHPDTVATLSEMGFGDPAGVGAAVRAWHHGRYRATSSTRSRQILTELMPKLLAALARTADPDQALRRFDEFIGRLPAGVQLFSLFQANPSLLDLVAEIMGTSPRLAEILSRQPLLLDGVLEPDFFVPIADPSTMAAAFEARLAPARDMQDVLDLARRWANDMKFEVGVKVLRGLLDADRAGEALADIADTVIAGLLPRVHDEFAERHGHCDGDGLAVLALGKLGGRELSATSDLDLVFIYDAGEDDTASDGERPLSPGHYHQRLGQRLINALTALTGEGRLYDVDMRLRPSGNAGPLAVRALAFARYQAEQAWTWEHMALTRARVVAGAPALARRIEAAIAAALTAPRDDDPLLGAVAEMRARIAAEHHGAPPWQIKHMAGGLVDCEFLAQYLQLRHAHAHVEILDATTATVFGRLADAGLLPRPVADELVAATLLWRRLQAVRRLTVGDDVGADGLPTPLRTLLARAGEAVDYGALEDKVWRVAARVHDHYDRLIEAPAAALTAADREPAQHQENAP